MLAMLAFVTERMASKISNDPCACDSCDLLGFQRLAAAVAPLHRSCTSISSLSTACRRELEGRFHTPSNIHQIISSGVFRKSHSIGSKVIQVNPTSATEKCSPVGNTRILSNNTNEHTPISWRSFCTTGQKECNFYLLAKKTSWIVSDQPDW